MRGRHFFWSQQQIAVSGIGSIDYRRIFNNSEARRQVKGKASYLTLDEVARDENDGRRATVCATVVDVTEHTYKDRETGSRKRFAKLTLSQNNRLAECVCWNDYYMEHHTVIQSLKDRVVILTASSVTATTTDAIHYRPIGTHCYSFNPEKIWHPRQNRRYM